MHEEEPQSLHMEDKEANELAENPQGSDKKKSDSPGVSVPDGGANDTDAADAGIGTGGLSGPGEGQGMRGGSQGEGGGASQGGGTGNA